MALTGPLNADTPDHACAEKIREAAPAGLYQCGRRGPTYFIVISTMKCWFS
jgi:hypothetical protein